MAISKTPADSEKSPISDDDARRRTVTGYRDNTDKNPPLAPPRPPGD